MRFEKNARDGNFSNRTIVDLKFILKNIAKTFFS